MSKKAPTKLPDKPSALIRLALRDLEKCERSRKYKVDMATWHEPNGVCRVCLAGAVMAKTMHTPADVNLEPWMIYERGERELYNKLVALDYFRCGNVGSGLHMMGLSSGGSSDQFVTRYPVNKTQFKRDMRKLAAMLAKEGL